MAEIPLTEMLKTERTRLDIIAIRDGQCRYSLSAGPPHVFCSEVTALDRVYCDKHHEVCHLGYGKNVRALEEMIYGMEGNVVRSGRGLENTVPLDEELRGKV